MSGQIKGFPEGFLWGSATSSHQVEGDNSNNDWWQWEEQRRVPFPSGQATRHYELFESDFQLASVFHHNAHRFSIEWSRIEPQEGFFSNEALAHYTKVIQSLRKKNIEPIVTLHHFTHPVWFAKKGGWLNKESVSWFVRYTDKIVQTLGKEVKYWITINEPTVLAYHGYFMGIWPPGETSAIKTFHVIQRLIQAHRTSYTKIHKVYSKEKWTRPMVSFAHNLMVFKVCPLKGNLMIRVGVDLRHRLYNLYFLHKTRCFLDFIGINYYAREYVSYERGSPLGILGEKCNSRHGHVGHLNQLGWDHYPIGLWEVLSWLIKFKKPILITENGTCEKQDEFRWQFIKDHLKELKKALEKSVPVIGYLYWSLLDNFEWHHGFAPRFGLIEVDYTTFKRTPRKSAYRFAEICKTNCLIE